MSYYSEHLIKDKLVYTNNIVLDNLSERIDQNTTLLDLGCGPKVYSSPFKEKCKKILTIDAFEWVEPDIVADLEVENLFKLTNNETFDYILMIDFIEHLDKEAGKNLIRDCKKICNKKIFLLTPYFWDDNKRNVEDPRFWCYNNQYDLHKSLWEYSDFEGWHEIGIINNHYFGYWQNE